MAQAKLPQGRSQLRSTLRTTRISEDDEGRIFKAHHPPAVKALIGRTLTLPGFIMPLDTSTRGTHFLLSKYTPVCAFCPPGEPNEAVEIRTAVPVAYSDKLVSVTGTFGLGIDCPTPRWCQTGFEALDENGKIIVRSAPSAAAKPILPALANTAGGAVVRAARSL